MHFPLTILESVGALVIGFCVGLGWAIAHWLVARVLK